MTDVKYLKGSSEQYNNYLKAGKIVDTNFYYIDEKDLYLGKIKLSNKEDIDNAIANLKLSETYATKLEVADLLKDKSDATNLENGEANGSIKTKDYIDPTDGSTQPGGTVNGIGAIAFGKNNIITDTAKRAAAIGNSNYVAGNSGFAQGQENEVYESCGVAMGRKNINHSTFGFMAGFNNIIQHSEDDPTNRCVVLGSDNMVYHGEHNYLIGVGLKSDHNLYTALGKFNDYNNADALLVVGNGTSENNRSNAFEVLRDSRAKVYGTPIENEDVVRLKDLSNYFPIIKPTEKNVYYFSALSVNNDNSLSFWSIKGTPEPSGEKVVIRSKQGRAQIQDPVEEMDIANKQYVDTTIKEQVAAIVASAPDDFDTLKEMSDWIASHTQDATAMNSAILVLQEKKADKIEVESLTAEVEGLKEAVGGGGVKLYRHKLRFTDNSIAISSFSATIILSKAEALTHSDIYAIATDLTSKVWSSGAAEAPCFILTIDGIDGFVNYQQMNGSVHTTMDFTFEDTVTEF